MQHLDLYDPDFKPHMFRGTSYSEPAGICSSACPFSMLLLFSFCSFIYIFFSLLLSSRLFSSRRFISLLFPSLLFSCFLLSFLLFCSWQFSFWVGQGQGHDARNDGSKSVQKRSNLRPFLDRFRPSISCVMALSLSNPKGKLPSLLFSSFFHSSLCAQRALVQPVQSVCTNTLQNTLKNMNAFRHDHGKMHAISTFAALCFV